jgi:membrane-associated phospholipid phosphatase
MAGLLCLVMMGAVPGLARAIAPEPNLSLNIIVAPAHAGATILSADTLVARSGFDVDLVRNIYNIDHPAFTAWMRAADASFYPLMFVAVPGAFLAESVTASRGSTLTMAGALGSTYVVTVLGKHLAGRERPYSALPDIELRERARSDRYAFQSFPSGHASMSFAAATAISLSFPEWYVIAPAVLWASSVTLSRMWLGVHFPSDLAAGAALGMMAGAGSYFLTTLVLGSETVGANSTPISVVIPIR